MKQDLPDITEDLLVFLKETFPNELTKDLNFEERQIAYQQGQQSVINELQILYRKQNGELQHSLPSER